MNVFYESIIAYFVLLFYLLVLPAVKQQSQSPSPTVKMNGLHPPLTSVSAPCLCGRQEGERNECFRPRIVWCFLISARIILYCHRKSRHHLGTKILGFAAISNTMIGEKVSIYNGFQGLMILSRSKSNTIFYCR